MEQPRFELGPLSRELSLLPFEILPQIRLVKFWQNVQEEFDSNLNFSPSMALR